ncbi:MAG: DUF2249 domain-containing protein [Magnetococcales bacterium]|nr:DUF2249 domain-containing protein [Magnetococcales bacterium]
MSNLFLDVRALPAPEPLQQILVACGRLQTEVDTLTVYHRCQPCLLSDHLRQRGLVMTIQQANDELFILTIRHDKRSCL